MKHFAFFSLAALTALLPGCASQSAAPVAAPTQVTGRVMSGVGSGTVSLSGTSSAPLVSAPLGSDGRFTLTLPDAGALSSQLVSMSTVLAKVGCSGTLVASNAASGFGFAALDTVRGGQALQVYSATVQGHLASASAELNMDVWVYSDQDTALSGTLDCTQLAATPEIGKISVAFVNAQAASVALKAGWNILHFRGKSGLSAPYNVSGFVFTTPAPSGENWYTLEDAVKNRNVGL